MTVQTLSRGVRGARVTIAAPSGARGGNRVTALRWAKLLRGLGCAIRVEAEWTDGACDVLVALHARHSARSIERFAVERPTNPLIVIAAGTDLYHDVPAGGAAARTVRASLEHATRVVVLQPLALELLPDEVYPRARVVYQSVSVAACGERPARPTFDVCVLSNLRAIKDPLLAAEAARLLPSSSRVRVLHAGVVIEPAFEAALEREQRENPRLRALGALRRGDAMRALGGADICVCSSRLEGGPNVISEALAMDVPVLASRIPGCVGLLGEGHPGYFPPGDAGALARLIARAETDERYLDALRTSGRKRAWITDPELESRCLESLLSEVLEERAP